jgi:outer membrane biosynthesis protein TonB
MQLRIVQRRRMEGWGFSLALHGVLLAAIVPLFRHLPAPIVPEPFRWNVTFIESPQQTALIEPNSHTSSTKEFLRASETDVHNSVSPPMGALTSPKQAKVDRSRAAKESSDTTPLLATSPPEVSPQMSSSTETTPVTQDTLFDEQPDANMVAPPLTREPSGHAIIPVEQAELPAPISSAADEAITQAEPGNTPPTSPPLASLAASDQPSSPQTDYSWLQRAVSRRLEELKRSSRPSLDNSSRLKVLVKAVVSSTGELMEAEVVTSSGLDRIDQEAMRLVQHAFPMLLDHTLDRQQVVMRIPIVYSRD